MTTYKKLCLVRRVNMETRRLKANRLFKIFNGYAEHDKTIAKMPSMHWYLVLPVNISQNCDIISAVTVTSSNALPLCNFAQSKKRHMV